MATETLKNNPNDVLKREGISKKQLSEKALNALRLFDTAYGLSQKRPSSKELLDGAVKAADLTNKILEKEIAEIRRNLESKEQKAEKEIAKRVQSKAIVEKNNASFDELEHCRQALKEDRQRKLESGEIKPPVKKTLATKLRAELMKTAGLIPKNLKEDKAVIQKTKKAILNFLNELKSIWGMNKIKPIEDELNEKFGKLMEQAEH